MERIVLRGADDDVVDEVDTDDLRGLAELAGELDGIPRSTDAIGGLPQSGNEEGVKIAKQQVETLAESGLGSMGLIQRHQKHEESAGTVGQTEAGLKFESDLDARARRIMCGAPI